MLASPLLALLLAPTHLLLAPALLLLLLLTILALLLLLPLLLLEVGLSSTACCCGWCLLSITRLEAGSGLVGRHGPLLLGHAVPTHASTSPLALLELTLLWVATSAVVLLLLLILLLSHVPVHALLVLMGSHHALLSTNNCSVQRLTSRSSSQVAVAPMP